jgi:O-antigen/teichoic acid export membrane protein
MLAIFSLLDLGLSTTLNREIARLSTLSNTDSRMHDLVRTLELVYWLIAILIGIAVISLAPLITHHWVKAEKLSPTSINHALIIMGFAIACQWPFALYSGGLMGLQRQVLLNGITAFIATVRGLGAVLLLWKISPTIQAYFLWQIFVSLLQTILTRQYLLKSLPARLEGVSRFNRRLLSGVWRFAAGMTGISVLAVILTQLDKVILSRMLPLKMFGYYSFAVTVASGMFYGIMPLFSAFFPRFSQLVELRNEEELRRLYHESCQLMSVIILPVCLIIVFFAKDILILWTKDQTLAGNTSIILALLITGNTLNGLVNLPYALQLAHGWTKLGFYQNLLAVGVMVPLLIILVNAYGATGAAIVWVAINACYVFFGIQVMHRRLLTREKWRWYGADIGLPLLASVIAVGAGRYLALGSDSQISTLLWIVTSCVIAYAAAIMAAPLIRAKIMTFVPVTF